MRYKNLSRYWRITASATGLVVPLAMASTAFSQPPSPRSEVTDNRSATNQQTPDRSESEQSEGVEYLTRGPLHEAFAEPYDANPEASPVVQKQPPEPIDELPPEYRPDGKNVIWIPGYWSWDDERDDFIWVSGVWRDLPPGQQWIPGYWDQADSGYRYIGGFWASSNSSEVQYLPEPPKSLDQGPSSPAPGEDHFYVPGNWVYESNDYQWQPGFWSSSHDDWVWVPAQYVWTPRGCVYQAGYWDHDVAHRGVLFTPVYYSQPIYQNAGYSYQPRYTIDTSVGLFVHLFVRPSHRHYYFGDYYGPRYSDNYYSWSTRYQGHQHYDPFFASYNNRNRRSGSNNVLGWITNQYQVFASNDRYRPARTIADQRNFLRSNQNTEIDSTVLRLTSLGESLDVLANNQNSDLKLQRIDNNEVDRVRQSLNPLRDLSRERLNLEGSSANADASVNADANVDGNARAGANAEGRGSLRLPGRDQGESSPVSDLSNAANDLLNGGNSDNRSQQNDSNRNPRGDAAMDRARDAANNAGQQSRDTAERAGDRVEGTRDMAEGTRDRAEQARDKIEGARDKAEQARDKVDQGRDAATREAGDAANSIRERMNRSEDRTRDAIDPATPADSLRNANPTRGLEGASVRARNELRRQTGEATGQTRQADQREALRPQRPENWPSQIRRNADRAIPEQPRLNNSRGNQSGQPGNLLPNRGGNANPGNANPGKVNPGNAKPGRALRNATEPAAPAIQQGINKATQGATGGGNAVQDALKGVLGG